MATEKQKLKKDGTPSRQGEGGGPKLKTEEELTEGVNGYLIECDEKKQMPNKAGLCVFLEFCRDTYSEYKKFSDAIKRFEMITQNAWVQRLGGNSPTGAIFYLKNAFAEDFKDRHETDLTSGGQPISVIVPQAVAETFKIDATKPTTNTETGTSNTEQETV